MAKIKCSKFYSWVVKVVSNEVAKTELSKKSEFFFNQSVCSFAK